MVAAQPFLIAITIPGTEWVLTRDGDPHIYAMYRWHYSARRYRRPRQPRFAGPGEKIVLIHVTGLAAFVWRKFIDGSGQKGVCNALFVNHGAGLSSELIRQAENIAWQRWPGERLYTYVNPRKVKSKIPDIPIFAPVGERRGTQRAGS